MRSVDLILRHAAVIAQDNIGFLVHQIAGIVEDAPAQSGTGQRKGYRDAKQHREKGQAPLLAFFAGIFGTAADSACLTFLTHRGCHHLFRNFFREISVVEDDGRVLHIGIERFQHLRRAAVAVGWQLCHGTFRDLHKTMRHSGSQLLQGAGLIGDLLHGHGHYIVGVKGKLAREHFVHHDAHRINITLAVCFVPLGLFRADIMNTAHGLAAAQLIFGPGDPRDAKIHHPELAIVQQHDVLRLDVPVHHAVAVGMVKSL